MPPGTGPSQQTEPNEETSPRERAPKKARRRPHLSLLVFYRQVIAELRKVVWPTRSQLVTYVNVVIAFLVVVMALVYFVDLGYSHLAVLIFG